MAWSDAVKRSGSFSSALTDVFVWGQACACVESLGTVVRDLAGRGVMPSRADRSGQRLASRWHLFVRYSAGATWPVTLHYSLPVAICGSGPCLLHTRAQRRPQASGVRLRLVHTRGRGRSARGWRVYGTAAMRGRRHGAATHAVASGGRAAAAAWRDRAMGHDEPPLAVCGTPRGCCPREVTTGGGRQRLRRGV